MYLNMFDIGIGALYVREGTPALHKLIYGIKSNPNVLNADHFSFSS